MDIKLTISEPQLRGKEGHISTPKVWHFLSHSSGGHNNEDRYILESCGLRRTKEGVIYLCPIHLSDGCVFDKYKFWLSKPNKLFTMRYHTRSCVFNDDRCYVDHYYYAREIGEDIVVEFVGQNCVFYPYFNHYSLYKIGDEKSISFWKLLFG